MTIRFGHVRQWRADVVAQCARSVAANRGRLEALGVLLVQTPRSGGAWVGEAAQAAEARHAELIGDHRRLVTGVAAIVAALERAAEQIAAITRLVHAAEEVARWHGLAITDAGQLVDVPGWSTSIDPAAAQAVSLAQERARWEVRDDVEQLVARAAWVEATLGAGLVKAAEGSVMPPVGSTAHEGWAAAAGAGPTTPLVPAGLGRPGWTPWDGAAWWALLTPTEREQVIRERPDAVGPTNGVPAWARDRANRTLLDRAEESLVVDELRLRLLADAVPVAMGGGILGVAYQRTVARLSSVRELRSVATAQDGRTRQVLLVDVTGRIAKAAVSVGDVDRAGHVAVFVGGITTTVGGDLRRYDTVMGQMTDLATRQSQTHGDGGDVAAVTWMGYEAPQWNDLLEPSRSVLLSNAAQAGAPPLAAFANGLDAARAPGQQPHLTLWAHSYGSPTAGLALAGTNTGVDDLAAFGSPGLGVSDLAQLHLPSGRVHVLETGDDVIADSGRFGRDPDHLPGADVLSTSAMPLPDGSVGTASKGHSEYLNRGSTSAWNLAAVAAGTPQLLVRSGECGEFAPPKDVSCTAAGGG